MVIDMTTDRVFVLLMMILLMMAGCFEATSTTEAEEEQDSTTGNDGSSDNVPNDGTDLTEDETTSNQNSNIGNNHPPVISAEIISHPAFYNGNDCTSTGIEFEVRHAMMDWDGTIISAGWDINLDGQIDFPVTVSEGYTDIRIAFDDMIENIVIDPSMWGNNADQHYYERSIVFGAQDDDGQWTSSELFEISRVFGYTQDNTFSYASGYDFEQCDDFEDVTDYEFLITDHADYVNSGAGDYLLNIERVNGQNGIDLSRITILISLYGNSSDDMHFYTNSDGCYIVNDGTCEIIVQSSNSNTQIQLFETNDLLEIRANGNVGWFMDEDSYDISVSIIIDNILVQNEYVTIS